jgi:hypothetical protein
MGSVNQGNIIEKLCKLLVAVVIKKMMFGW